MFTTRSILLIILLFSLPNLGEEGSGRRFQDGWELITQRNFPAAKNYFRKAYIENRVDAEAAFALGKIFYQQCDTDSAMFWWKIALDIHPSQSGYHLWYSRALAKKGLASGFIKKAYYGRKVKKRLLQAIQYDSTNTIARHDLIRYYLVVPAMFGGGVKKAVNQANRLKQFNPWEGYKAFGEIYLHKRQYENAEKNFHKALERFPGDAQFLTLLFETLQRRGKYGEIDAILTASRTSLPDSGALTAFWKAVLARENGDDFRAIRHLQQAVAANPQDAKAVLMLVNLVLSHPSAEGSSQALQIIEKFLRHHPYSDCNTAVVEARSLRRKLLEKMGN